MFKGKNLRLIALTIFVILFTWGLILYAEPANAAAPQHSAVIGLGIGIIHLDDSAKSQSVGYRYGDRWEARYTRTGNTYNRDEERVKANHKVEIMRVIKWREDKHLRPLLKFGAAYWHDTPVNLVNERLQYSLVLGVSFRDTVELTWAHNSTAGRSKPNSGVDYVALDFTMGL